ncbi:MAG: NAD(P)-dependent oxidoreductase [Candidatus Micrarchaeota archaeon]
MPKIIIADKMEKEVVEKLKQIGEVEFQPSSLQAALKSADVLIVRSATKVTKELISNANNLKIVARAGVGTDNIDKEACKSKKIKVINTPDASTNAVAELAIGMMIGIMRKTGTMHEKMKNNTWAKKEGVGNEIQGKTLGIIGMGRIGHSVAKKASSLGMNVIYYDHKKKEVEFQYFPSIDEMLPNADIISLHASASEDSPPLISTKQFSKIKKGAFLINTARGSLIDEDALVEALNSGKLGGAAIDVYSREPYINGSLTRLDNILLTPHIGASTKEAQLRIGDDLIAQLRKELGV